MAIISGEHSTVDVDHKIYCNWGEPNITVGSYTQIGSGTKYCGNINHPWIIHRKMVSTFSFATQWGIDYLERAVSRGDITIGSDVWIGDDVSILDGVHIGDGAIVGAFTVVAKDVPPYAVVVGNPAQIKHYRFTEDQIKKLLKIQWWNWTTEEVESRLEDMKDVDLFIKKYYKGGE